MTQESEQDNDTVLNSKNIQENLNSPQKQKISAKSTFIRIKKNLAQINKTISQQKIFKNQTIKEHTKNRIINQVQSERIHKLKQLLNFNASVRMQFINENLDAMLNNFIKKKDNKNLNLIKDSSMLNSNIKDHHNKSTLSQPLQIYVSNQSLQKNISLSLQNQKQNVYQDQQSRNTIHIKNLQLKNESKQDKQEEIEKRKSLQRLNLKQKRSNRFFQTNKRTNLFCKCQQKHLTRDKSFHFPSITQIQHIPQVKFNIKSNCYTSNKKSSLSPGRKSKNIVYPKDYELEVRRNNEKNLIQSSNTKYQLKTHVRRQEKRINEIKFKKRETNLLDFVY